MTILWQPDRKQIDSANITAFQRFIRERLRIETKDYGELHAWSIRDRGAFWGALWDFCGVIASQRGDTVLADGDRMPGASFFPDARLNYAQNLLRRRDEADAIVFQCENGSTSRLSYKELYEEVSRLAQALRSMKIKSGDRIAALMPNIPDTVVGALASASMGAVWSSCSPDFGTAGVLDRFRQIEPRVLIACDGYFYNGREIDILDKLRAIVSELPTLERVLIVPFVRQITGDTLTTGGIPRARLVLDHILRFEPRDIEFEQLPFDHPLYIMFSSGTTGLPKCIVHGAGGALLQHLKEHRLHFDIRRDDRAFWFTTCGWMMWNWLISTLACEARLLLYDGSPFYPDANALFEFAQDTRMTHMGLSAKFIQACEKAGARPIRKHDLGALRVIGSTGSTLLPEGFDYVYDNIKKDVCLSSVSGGTDILSCFVGGSPTLPVRRGEIQAKTLGMAVEVWDESGQKVIGQKGELVCTRAFPSMPVGFLNDPDGTRYREAYFARFPNVWVHGDFAEETAEGGFLIYGRSDATLNPGGVRIGTAEIYRQVERLPEVVESVAISQEWDGDVRVVLFVVLKPGMTLNERLTELIKTRIREGTTPRHVPAKIVQVPEIPRTRSGKITELAIRETVHGRAVKNLEAIGNPDSLDHFRDLAELKS